MKSFFLAASLFLHTCCAFAQNKLLTPSEFLGYEPGDRFTSHHRALTYFTHISEALPNAEMHIYGRTYEDRPLGYLVITSQENFKRLDDIRLNHLKSTGLIAGDPTEPNIAIVWLSYNVHGNEASSMEAAMKTAFALVDRDNDQTQQWLKNTVVIIDPCMNPDGRDRYANFYAQYGNRPPNPNIDGFEHHEPWPGGRTNHYFFDLNRDWAWATQVESQQRLAAYNSWLPHVHVDFHEQNHNNPYFFAPAAEPMHEVISDWQREFQLIIGKNNARHFDKHGWLYFTKEVFDLYYPSYGDTYPTYSGAVGMTYEQAGGGVSGLAVTTETGDPLSLQDRIMHHHTSALSTIEITSQHAKRVIGEFIKYFEDNNHNPASPFKTYLIKGTNGEDKLRRLTSWLDLHAIRYGHPSPANSLRGFSYRTRANTSVSASPDDLVIDIHQPKSRFITTVFEPVSKLSDSLTYDITAWNLLYAFDLEAYALMERLPVATAYNPLKSTYDVNERPDAPYAYIFKYEGLDDVALLTALLQQGIRVRAAQKAFAVNGHTFAAGSLIITRGNNQGISALDSLVNALAAVHNRKVFISNSGFVDQGRDLGSDNLNYISAPEVAMLFGAQTSPLSAGEIWHFFEQEVKYPVTQLGTNYFANVDLGTYDVIVVPEGSYTLFDDAQLERLSSWISTGGRLILISTALNSFVDKKGFALKRYRTEAEKTQAENLEKTRIEKGFSRYEAVEREQISSNISGAIFQLPLDNSHPVAFGMRNEYYTLKTHEQRFAPLNDGWNVAYFGETVAPVQGFAGFRANDALKNSLVLGVEEKGEGEIVYFVDNPLFRSFWESGKMLFANAVFLADH